jgi:glycosyltransferase involved in cell wall biosynthesis
VITLTYSLADQNFHTTKSVGIFNLSVRLLSGLAAHPEVSSLTVLRNSTLQDDLPNHVQTLLCDRAASGRLGRVWWDQWGVYQAARKAGREWLFLPKGFASFLRACPVKLALYVHDTILESYYRERRGMPRSELMYFRRCLSANLRYGRLIFTNSDFTRSEIERVAARAGWPVPPLVNVGMGFDSPPQSGVRRENEVLVLASPFRHKRTDLAVTFLKRWQEQTRFDGTVRWVGNLPADVSLPQFAGWSHAARLPELEYRQAISRARVLVFFSEYEGFGMPPVEAIVQGACPVYSDLPATQEVLAGKGCPFRNDDYESFSQAILKALRTTPAQLEDWREKLLSQFNWNRVCTRVVEALKLSARTG